MPTQRLFKPGTLLESYRWRWLAMLAEEYPARMDALIQSVPAYHMAVAELGDLHLHFLTLAVIEGGLKARVPYTQTPHSPGANALFEALHTWAAGLNLVHLAAIDPFGRGDWAPWPDGWVVAYGARLLSRLVEQPQAGLMELCRSEADPARISAVNYQRVEAPMPNPPHYLPEIEDAETYLGRVEEYMRAKRQWARTQNSENEQDRPELETHLRWLAWQIVEGLSLRKIAARQNLTGMGEQGHTAVKQALDQIMFIVTEGLPYRTIWQGEKLAKPDYLRGKHLQGVQSRRFL